MDLVAPTKHPHKQFFSFEHMHKGGTRTCGFRGRMCDNTGTGFSSVRVYVGCKARFLVSSSDSIIEFSEPKGPRKHLGNRVYAVSKVDYSGLNGRLRHYERIPQGKLNGVETLPNGFNTSRNFESTINLRRLVRKGELEEALKFLDRMTCHGNIPDVIACTTPIRGFCKFGRTKKATRVMEILEESRAAPDVITYNVLISGYCRSGKKDKAMEVLDRQLQRECYPDVITYTILIEATSKESGVGQAMKLSDEMRRKGCKPDAVTYSAHLVRLK